MSKKFQTYTAQRGEKKKQNPDPDDLESVKGSIYD